MGTYFQTLTNQKGAFSPFMYGLLLGVAMLSTLSKYQAEKALEQAKVEQKKRQNAQVEGIKQAFENAILTENVAEGSLEFSADATMDRAQAFLTGTSTQTTSKEAITLNQREGESHLGINSQKVFITNSDNEFTKEKVERIFSASEVSKLNLNNQSEIAVFDSEEARLRQIKQSTEYLRMEQSQIYRFWGSNDYSFPKSQNEYEEKVNRMTGLKDVWGQTFKYTYITKNKAKISFTSPWGFEKSITLDMDL